MMRKFGLTVAPLKMMKSGHSRPLVNQRLSRAGHEVLHGRPSQGSSSLDEGWVFASQWKYEETPFKSSLQASASLLCRNHIRQHKFFSQVGPSPAIIGPDRLKFWVSLS